MSEFPDAALGYIAPGVYGNRIGKSLARGYLRVGLEGPGTGVEFKILGEARPRVLVRAPSMTRGTSA